MGQPSEDFRAGASAVALPLEIGAPMMGYGARDGGATGVHDPLHARGLYVAGDGSDLLVVAADLCLIGAGQAAALRTRLAGETGLPPERIAITCIHTHSGPDTGLMAFLSGNPPPAHVPAIFDAIVEAGKRAVGTAGPATLAVGHGEAAIGRNRRRPGGPVERDVLALRFDRPGGEPLAVAYTHGCHPTALGHENLAYSADWVASAHAEVEAAFPGAVPIFWLGAHADVDPRSRGLLDLAVAGQSLGVGFDEVAALGREVGREVVRAARDAMPVPAPRVRAGSAQLAVPTHVEDPAQRAEALEALGLPDDAEVGTGELFAMEHERTDRFPIAEKRERLARVRRYLRGRTARHFVGGTTTPDVEVQVLRIGPAELLALPAEATVAVGRDWRARRGPHAAVLSIANGWLRYLPHPRDFDEPDAHHGYEVLMSTLVPDAAVRLLRQGEKLADALAAADR